MADAIDGSADGSAAIEFPPFPAVVDIELTSRCNAHCTFCPRDQTPHQGLIDDRTFTAALGRAVEYRDALLHLQEVEPGYFDVPDDAMWLSFCGMGEPLLHPRVVEYVGRVAEAGLRPIINTNGALLNPRLAEELMDAGLVMVCLNVGEIDEQYEAVYGLPFERTRANLEHLFTAARGRCAAVIILVDHRDDPDHVVAMQEYWTQRGAEAFMPFNLVNRGGSLQVDEQVATWHAHGPEARRILEEQGGWTRCWVPFLYPFISYDGTYNLCSSDWRKEVDLGNVFEASLTDLLDEKVAQVSGRSPICSGCTHEPTNALARLLERAADPPDREVHPGLASTPDALLAGLDHFAGQLAALRTHLPRTTTSRGPVTRRLIPVRS